ncbi:hypothetical protein VitviT2T_027592 [Vitis vinifera]|uniref:Succinate dehydrogenase subunit 5, mitochondrial n=2 Tax=Vitis vinifera TaxID=29760 RepID=A5B894_VITVI|eukprot:XP_002284591.1 PREDICTED: succinate dehydrogenase subunit 5, mitochondrial [Vitis vinifera]
MERMVLLRSLFRSAAFRSCRFSAVVNHHQQLRHYASSRSLFNLFAPTAIASRQALPSDCRTPFAVSIGSTRSFSEDVSHLPVIKDPEIQTVFKDLMAASWDELPDSVISSANKVLSKNTDDKAGQEALANVFRAAEAAVEFGGILVTLRMEIDDLVGISGENVKPLPDEFVNALVTVFKRYTTYLDSFGPDEAFLRKKVEMELGTKMIHLKLRCSDLGAEWGKVTLLGTSGLSGSYVEQRAP